MMRLFVCLLLTFVLAGACYCQNPYCIAGNGILTQLGMPPGCLDYSWDELLPANLINFVRPCRYWLYIGSPHKYWGYHETTDTIDGPTQFAAYVSAHPGKIWVIGNEPDLPTQDGITQDQYANMFHTYYTFIKNLDPTSRFCIGAVAGGWNSAGLAYTTGWYEAVLALYKSKFGVTMPVDIWNVHSYCAPDQIEDPDRPINEFTTPFVNWCHTVESGAYAGCEVWITELPLNTWANALSEDNVIWFMQRYLPRLEHSGVSRFFWYVSGDWDLKQGSCGLTRSGQVTTVGAAYAALARSYPNDVIPMSPYVPDPTPSYYACDFSGPLANPWMIKGGAWGIDAGTLRQTGIPPMNGTTCCLQYVHQDLGVSFKMKISAALDPIYWGGIAVRLAGRYYLGWESGYMLFVRQNGAIGLNNNKDGTVVEIPGGVDHPENWHTYRMLVIDNNFKVWVDDALKIDWTDADRHYASGYTIVQAHRSDVSYDDFHVLKYPTPLPVVTDDGAYTTELAHIRANWSAGDPGCGIAGYRYAVGTSSGASNVIDWTYTPSPLSTFNVQLSPPLTPGTKYYVSVKAVYTDGFESVVASSDGITAAVGCASILQAKSLPGSTCVLVEGKVVSRVFSDSVYIQEPNRSSGIRVMGTFSLQPGDVVSMRGTMGLSGKEAVVQNGVLLISTPGTPPEPLLMNNRALAGSEYGLQPAAVDAVGPPVQLASGLNPVGLLARTSGKVTYVDPLESYAYVDDGCGLKDGSGYTGLRFPLAFPPIPAVGSEATITGCCGAIDVGGNCVRYLRPGLSSDAQFVEVANWLANGGFEKGVYDPWVSSGTGGGLHNGTWYSVKAHIGSYFFGSYGAKVCYSGTLYQSVDVRPGDYHASVWSVIFHPSTSDAEVTKNRVGIDPAGGTDPNAPTVVWSAWDTTMGMTITPWHEISTPAASVTGGRCTVFLEYLQNDPTRYHMNCFDDVRLISVP